MWVYALLLLLITYDAVRVACLAVEGVLWLWRRTGPVRQEGW